MVDGFKNLDHETLTQTFQLLGRLAGQFPNAEDVEVMIEDVRSHEEVRNARDRRVVGEGVVDEHWRG